MNQHPDKGRTLYWHDYETWGENPASDRPSQFAGVRTDEQLNVIDEPLMLYCQPPEDALPKPEACLVTGITPQQAQAEGVPEREFIAAIHAQLARPGTCGVGYNSIRFDDEVTRYTLYRNFYDPYEREWRNGNSRWDIIDMLRMTRALRPEGIQWPDYEDGRPCFRLERLTAANGLSHEAAHDALSDVYATIAMARLVRERQPRLYDYAYRLRDKRFARKLIDLDGRKPLLHISSKFGWEQAYAGLVVPLAMHPSNANSVIVFNLSQSPKDLLELSVEALQERLFVTGDELPEGVERLALKEVHLNKTPMLLPPTMLDGAAAERLGIDRDRCERHWQTLVNMTLDEQSRLAGKLQQLYQQRRFETPEDPERQLYNGFLEDADRALLAKVRAAPPEELAALESRFRDPRMPELLFRYRARNFPATLSPPERERWAQWCRFRLSDPGTEVNAQAFQVRLQAARDRVADPAEAVLLEQLAAYGAELLARHGLAHGRG
ncbi:exodeoxyribonuclease I [Marinimicrobium alkaliphilum]|uniref:exodeoxyribonuclease I n=1 Tax=Marinimicrobium alkaliphilum TaxID=2202654 RepID=UPI000DB991FF|nr:exodeoxyribonuclease I [Marinimicrobium alkaliphilum]